MIKYKETIEPLKKEIEALAPSSTPPPRNPLPSSPSSFHQPVPVGPASSSPPFHQPAPLAVPLIPPMMPIMDMWAWVRETIEPLTREVKALREEVKELKHENTQPDRGTGAEA